MILFYYSWICINRQRTIFSFVHTEIFSSLYDNDNDNIHILMEMFKTPKIAIKVEKSVIAIFDWMLWVKAI